MGVYKFFGGSMDGQAIALLRTLKQGEPYRVARQPKLPPVSEWMRDEPVAPVTIEFDEYITEDIGTSKLRVQFLRHSKLSFEALLLRVFGP